MLLRWNRYVVEYEDMFCGGMVLMNVHVDEEGEKIH